MYYLQIVVTASLLDKLCYNKRTICFIFVIFIIQNCSENSGEIAEDLLREEQESENSDTNLLHLYVPQPLQSNLMKNANNLLLDMRMHLLLYF